VWRYSMWPDEMGQRLYRPENTAPNKPACSLMADRSGELTESHAATMQQPRQV
jgi:hypothetical protein